MQSHLDCVPCFLGQALGAARQVSDDPALHERILRATLERLHTLDLTTPPPVLGREIHRLIREATGDPDPYRAAKDASTALVLRLLPELEAEVAAAADPFDRAVRLAIAGNIIDLAHATDIDESRLRATLEDCRTRAPAVDHLAALRRAAAGADQILYLADNAGEIVLDRLLLAQLRPERTTVAVRGGPVINDATRADAEAAGLTGWVAVVDNGADVPGTLLAACAPAFRERFRAADLIIAKGQGNFETLPWDDPRIFFLFKVKCPIAARAVGCAEGEIVICNRPDQEAHAR